MNSLLLKVNGIQVHHTDEYMARRAKMKTIECALASLELSSKAWYSATIDMGRNFDLLCDALRALHNTEEHSLTIIANNSLDGSHSHITTTEDTKEGGATPKDSHNLYDDGHNAKTYSQEHAMVQVLGEMKSAAQLAFRSFATTMQEGVTSPIFNLISEFRECDALRHKRNRCQEQYDIDAKELAKKVEDYQRKGKNLSESKKHAEIQLKRDQSHYSLNAADAEYDDAFKRLTERSFLQTRKHVTVNLAESGIALCNTLRDHFKTVRDASSQIQSPLEAVREAINDGAERAQAAARDAAQQVIASVSAIQVPSFKKSNDAANSDPKTNMFDDTN